MAAQGVTMKAMASDQNMAALDPMGMGRMYGPISPPTNAIGNTAEMTAKVARMVGLPTSSTASTAMADQAVEVEGGGHAGIDLVICHLRLGAHGGGDFARRLGGEFERAAFGHIQDDLELALVVEGQHFHLHPAQADGGQGGEQQDDNADQEGQPPAGFGDHRAHDAAVEAGEQILLVREMGR